MKRYEKLADEIAQSIRNGVLRKGDKLPSVRKSSISRGVSPSTVFEAYYLLEAKGLITAKERSGYFVTGVGSGFQQLCESTVKPNSTPRDIDVSELVFDILESTRNRQVVPLGSAFPSPLLFPLERLAKALSSSAQSMDPWKTVADISPGDESLRRQIALRYMIDGIVVPTEDIIITSGAMEALNLSLAAVTNPGDSIIIESPSFYASLQAIERNKLKAVEIPNHPQNGIDLNALETAIKQHQPKAIWLMTNFQNPTGSLMSNANKQALVALISKYQIPLIEDDVYGELYFGNQRPLSAKAFDKEGLVMHCSSFSKCLAPGYRVGWVAPGKFFRTIEQLKLSTTIATSVPAQLALASYLDKGGYDKHLRNLRHHLLIQQVQFINAIEHCFPADTQLTRPLGGYFLWVKLPKGLNSLDIHRAALDVGISVAPGPMFSAQREFGEYIRLNYGHTWNNDMENAIAQIGQLMQ